MVFTTTKKIVKVAVVAAVVGLAVVAIVATAGAAAPGVVAAGVGVTTVTTTSVAGTAIAAGVTAAAITAGVGLAVAVGETIVEALDGSITFGNTYTIEKENADEDNLELFKKIAKTATLATLIAARESTRVYHIAFAVSQQFTEDNITYNVGDLYVSKTALTFDEAYVILKQTEIINSFSDITNNNELLELLAKTVLNPDLISLIETIKGYHNKGYFGKKVAGIYADSADAAANLAFVTLAWFRDGVAAYGGTNGWYHFHDFNRKIHIWYGEKIND